MKKNIKFISIVLGIFVIHGCATSGTFPSRTPAQASTEAQSQKEVPVTPVMDLGNINLDDLTYFTTPEDLHNTFIKAIEGAHDNIWMEMFHLTDKNVVSALEGLSNNVKVTLILDTKNASEGDGAAIATELEQHHNNFHIVKSSPKFEITHSKAMIIDYKKPNAKAYITSINLTNAADRTRDYGIITANTGIINQLYDVFQADITNATPGHFEENTPDITEDHLVFAPVPESAKGKLLGLILDAGKQKQKFVYSTVENLVDTDIMNAFVTIAQEGVDVRIIVPMCDENPNSSLNYKPLAAMVAQGVKGEMMPTTGKPETPYMHGKMIVTSGGTVYIGSENFSFSSLMKSRETGIIFTNPTIAKELVATFNVDWGRASTPAPCKASDSPTTKPPVKKHRPKKSAST